MKLVYEFFVISGLKKLVGAANVMVRRAPVAGVEPIHGVSGPRAVHFVQEYELFLRSDSKVIDLFLKLDI